MRNYIFRGRRIPDWKVVYGCLLQRGDYCAILEDNEDDVFMDAETGVIDGNLTPVDPETVELLVKWNG